MLAPVTHVLPLARIRRQRLLPVPGRVLVRKGQKVVATDVIAEADLAPEHILLNTALGLGVREELADRELKVKMGVQVLEGDVLAGPVGLTKRVIRAPRSGRVILAGSGQILMEVESPRNELRAGLPGTVLELIGDRGAVIEATGAVVQGVWGNGQTGFGTLSVLAQSPEEPLDKARIDAARIYAARIDAARIDVSLHGRLVLGGCLQDADVLKAAADLSLRGLILASLDSELVALAGAMPYPILVLDGFGQIPMNSAAFKLLSTSEKREAALIAGPWDRFKGTRPEVIIPLPAGDLPLPKDKCVFSPGQQVRILRAPYLGSIGRLVGLRPGMAVFPSGVQAQAGEVRLESGESAVLPLANLEVIA